MDVLPGVLVQGTVGEGVVEVAEFTWRTLEVPSSDRAGIDQSEKLAWTAGASEHL